MRPIALVACAFVFLLISAGTADAARNKNQSGFNPEYNQPAYWGEDCKKFERGGEETLWHTNREDLVQVIVKGGPAIETYQNINDGQTAFAAPHNPNSGKLYAISHVIECYGPTSVEPEEELDCEDEGFIDEEGICDESQTPVEPQQPTEPEENGDVLGSTVNTKSKQPEVLAETGVNTVTTIAAGTLIAVAAIGLSALRADPEEEFAAISL